MNDKMRAGMPEIMQLTRAGRLQDAITAIQRMLGDQSPTPGATEINKPTERAPIEGIFRVINEESSQERRARPEPPRPRPVSDRPPDGVPGGQFVTRSFTSQSGTRTYKLYVPSGYRGRPLPLVVMLHGCTQDPDDFAAGTRMNQVAEGHQYLVLYPAQAQGANISKCWNWFKEGDQRRDRGEPSIIAGMTLQVMSDYRIDSRRVYVAGLSAGGAMATIMGMTYPELYAAVGVHSGLPYAAAHDLPSALTAMRQDSSKGARTQENGTFGSAVGRRIVPTIVFHGDRDTTVHPCNGDQVIAQSQAINGANAQARIVPQATVQRGQVPHGHAYTRTLYRDGSDQSTMEHWLVHGAGHSWSGGCSKGSFTDPRGPDATQEMVRFFLEHPQLVRH